MNSFRKTAIIVGALFLIATAAGVVSLLFLKLIDNPDYLIKVSENENHLITGALLVLIMAFACAGIAIWLYPVLKKYNETLALGAVGFRIMEAVFHTIAIFGILPLLALSKEYVNALTPDIMYFRTIGSLLESVRDTGSNVGLIAWCVGAFMYYYVFYQSKLIPRWLSGWGLLAIILALAAVLFNIFALTSSMSTINTILNIPIAVQEMVLAIWLIAKGFNPSVITSLSNNQN